VHLTRSLAVYQQSNHITSVQIAPNKNKQHLYLFALVVCLVAASAATNPRAICLDEGWHPKKRVTSAAHYAFANFVENSSTPNSLSCATIMQRKPQVARGASC